MGGRVPAVERCLKVADTKREMEAGSNVADMQADGDMRSALLTPNFTANSCALCRGRRSNLLGLVTSRLNAAGSTPDRLIAHNLHAKQ